MHRFDTNMRASSRPGANLIWIKQVVILLPVFHKEWKSTPSMEVAGMPSLFRLLFTLAVLAGLVYGGMLALTLLVEPSPREMTVKIPAKRLNPQ